MLVSRDLFVLVDKTHQYIFTRANYGYGYVRFYKTNPIFCFVRISAIANVQVFICYSVDPSNFSRALNIYTS